MTKRTTLRLDDEHARLIDQAKGITTLSCHSSGPVASRGRYERPAAQKNNYPMNELNESPA